MFATRKHDEIKQKYENKCKKLAKLFDKEPEKIEQEYKNKFQIACKFFDDQWNQFQLIKFYLTNAIDMEATICIYRDDEYLYTPPPKLIVKCFDCEIIN